MTRFERVGPLLAALLAAFLLAYPVRGFLLGPSPALFKLLWAALLVIGATRRAWAPWLLVATVPLVPAAPYLWREVPFALVHLIVIALALPMLVRGSWRQVSRPPDGLQLVLSLFVVVALASAVVEWGGFAPFFRTTGEFAQELHRHLSTYVLEQPGRGIANAVPALTILLDGLLAYLIVRETLPSVGSTRLVAGVGAVAVVVAALGVAQAMTGIGLQYMWQRFDPGIIRVNSTYADPNALAAFLALTLPMLVGVAASSRSTATRGLWLAGAALVAVVTVLTGGRAGVLSAAVGVAIALGLGLWRRLDRDDPWPFVRRHLRRAYVAGGAAVVAVVVALTLVGTARDVRHADQDSYLDTALYTMNLGQPLDEKLKGRLSIWRLVGLMIKDAPTFGVGVGQVYGTFAVYNRRVQAFDPETRLSAHSTFLNIAAETGLIGLALWLTALALLLRAAFSAGDAREPAAIGWCRAGLAGGIAAFVLTMITGDRTVLREDLVIFGSVAAVAMAWSPQPTFRGWSTTTAVLVTSVLVLATMPARIAAEQRSLPMERITFGLHGEERGPAGEPFRWTTDRATLHVPADATTLVLSVRTLAPMEQTVRIVLDDRQVDALTLTDHAWRRVRYVLPPAERGRRYHRVDLVVSPTWQAPGDGRSLGVMLGDYGWESRSTTLK